MTNCLPFAIAASFRGFAAFCVSPLTLLACIIVVPAGVALTVVAYVSRSKDEEDAAESDHNEEVNTQNSNSSSGILSTRQWYAERYVPCALEGSVLERIPLVKSTCATIKEEMIISSCVVCLAPFEEESSWLRVLPPCQHAFHARCIDNWFQTHSTCPICRSKVSLPSADEGKVVHRVQLLRQQAVSRRLSEPVCLVEIVVHVS